jgi:hypothetical protein
MGVMGFVYDTGDERHVEFLVSRDLCFLYLSWQSDGAK